MAKPPLVTAMSSKEDKIAAKLARMAAVEERQMKRLESAAQEAGEAPFDEHDEAAVEATFGLNPAEYYQVRDEYEHHMVQGLNKLEFRLAIERLIEALNKAPPTEGESKAQTVAKPKKADLMKAFDLADRDHSGVVDLREFVSLYSKVKKGEVKGLGRWRLFR